MISAPTVIGIVSVLGIMWLAGGTHYRRMALGGFVALVVALVLMFVGVVPADAQEETTTTTEAETTTTLVVETTTTTTEATTTTSTTLVPPLTIAECGQAGFYSNMLTNGGEVPPEAMELIGRIVFAIGEGRASTDCITVLGFGQVQAAVQLNREAATADAASIVAAVDAIEIPAPTEGYSGPVLASVESGDSSGGLDFDPIVKGFVALLFTTGVVYFALAWLQRAPAEAMDDDR